MSGISVVVRMHDAAAVVDTALASLSAQSLPPEEVVVVDDGSTDSSVAVARRWQDRLPLRIVVHESNKGPGQALISGVDASKGDLITDLDADDYWLPDHLEVMECLHRQHGGVVSADALRWVPGRAIANRSWYQQFPPPGVEDQLRVLAQWNWVFSSTLMSRADYERVGGYRPLRSCEDWDLWLRLVAVGIRVHASRQPTVLYRISPNSVSRGAVAARAAERLLRDFQAQTSDPSIHAILGRSARRERANAHIFEAFDAVRNGTPTEGRRRAWRALRSPSWTRAVALSLAPRLATAAYDRVASNPQHQVGNS